MKTFVRALEDIAEVEQEKLFDQERQDEQKLIEEHAAASAAKEKADEENKDDKDGENKDLPLSDDEKSEGKATLSSALVSSDSPVDLKKLSNDYNVDKSEVVRFGKGSSKSRRSPKPQSKF